MFVRLLLGAVGPVRLTEGKEHDLLFMFTSFGSSYSSSIQEAAVYSVSEQLSPFRATFIAIFQYDAGHFNLKVFVNCRIHCCSFGTYVAMSPYQIVSL